MTDTAKGATPGVKRTPVRKTATKTTAKAVPAEATPAKTAVSDEEVRAEAAKAMVGAAKTALAETEATPAVAPQAAAPEIVPPTLPNPAAYAGMWTFGQANLQTAAAAGSVMVQGMRELTDLMMGSYKQSVDQGLDATKAAFACKSLKDLVALQTTVTKSAMETAMDDGAKVSERAIKLAEDVARPLAQRLGDLSKGTRTAA